MTQVEALAKYAARASFAALGAGLIRSLTLGSWPIDVDRRRKLKKS
jgi:hypothetical protein